MSDKKLAVVTGASAGIGAATAVALSEAGFEVLMGARRIDRLQAVAEPVGARFQQLDVTDPDSVEAFVEPIDKLDLLVNNAGGALGVDRIEAASDERWRTMWEVNFLGLARMTRSLLPALLASGEGHIVNVGSIAGFETYPGGAGYTGAKHAVRALTKTLRLELVGKPIRVTEICPGLVETEFSMVRFHGDAEKAESVYKGYEPLKGEDIADIVTFVVNTPDHVNILDLVVLATAQRSAHMVHKEPV